MSVFVLCDVECHGIIYGIFTTFDSAKEQAHIRVDHNTFNYWNNHNYINLDEMIGIAEIKLNTDINQRLDDTIIYTACAKVDTPYILNHPRYTEYLIAYNEHIKINPIDCYNQYHPLK